LRRKYRSTVERLAAILRLADALDRQHAGLVRNVQIKLTGERIELMPKLASGQKSQLTLERQAIEEKGDLFAQLFGRQVALLRP
jgi:exopolyphosphatase/guanosine-5'-triphosphate,3'-diphosphate pyrophosphatase